MEEMKNLLDPNGRTPEVEIEKHKMMLTSADVHYPGELVSGCHMLEKCIDVATSLSIRRDNGDGSMCASIKADVVYSGHCGDTVEIIVKSLKDGKRSRVYAFEMYKLIEFDNKKYCAAVLEEPKLMVKGEVTLVVEKAR